MIISGLGLTLAVLLFFGVDDTPFRFAYAGFIGWNFHALVTHAAARWAS